ncbi:extracellular solute-binding protein [Cohnella terricola]|uniref:Extracellular solute-binding protein n=1 Tax=Cohnella terricola TaxID=1289167 RepID=A0A559J8Q8_9BACL|nr:extracellular solute-binding protein [Cohnella terricola]TVX96280.1 extracellular solute-binding protein [Cohnella terricola]
MSRKKGLFALLVLLLSFTTVLAACGGKNNDAGGKSGEGSAAPSASGKATESSVAAAEQKPVLKALRNYMQVDYNSYPVNQYIEEKTGYKVQNDMLPQEKPSDKLNLIMASGTDYDFIDALNTQDFFNFAKNGALTDLTPLIEQYGPNIKQMLSPESLAGATVDGKIYGIPTLNVSYVRDGLLIRTDWLEKVGKSMPTTLDEFVDVLKAFKEQDPGGNGKNNIPLTIDSIGLVDNIMGAFGIYGQWNELDGKPVNVSNHPALKDYAAFMRSLYEQGLLDKEFATNKSATSAEKFTSGRAGVMWTRWSSIPGYDEAIKKNVPDAAYQFIPPMKGPDGQSGFTLFGGFNKITFVPKSAKHPEDVVKLVNAMLDPETFKGVFVGEEGVTYTIENGNYMPIEPAFFDQRGSANNFVIGMDESNFVTYWQARLQKSKAMFDNFQIVNNIPKEQIHQDVLAFAPYLPKYSANVAKLESAVNDYLIKMIVDGVSDDSIASLQKAWKGAGGEEVAQEVSAWYASK